MNGPQYIADRGISDAQFRAIANVLRVPTEPDLSANPAVEACGGMTPAAR